MLTVQDRIVNLNFNEVNNQLTLSKNTLDYALSFHHSGINVLPLKHRTKIPRIKWEVYESQKQTEDEVRSFFSSYDGAGVGVICGSVSNFLVVDVDGERWEDIANEFLRKFPYLQLTRMVFTGSGKIHIWIRCRCIPQTLTKKVRFFQDGHIEIRGNGHQCAAPDSLHPNGERYRFIDPNTPIVEINEAQLTEIVEWFDIAGVREETSKTKRNKSFDEPFEEAYQDFEELDEPVKFLLRQALKRACPGNRHDAGLYLALGLYNFGVSIGDAVMIMRLFSDLVPQPPKASHGYLFKEAMHTLRNVWREDSYMDMDTEDHSESCECTGHDSKTVKLPVWGPKRFLYLYLLLDLNVVRNKATKDFIHTCKHWKNPYKLKPYHFSSPKRGYGRHGRANMSFGKIWLCEACAEYLRRLETRKIRGRYPNGFFFEIFHYTDENFYDAVKTSFDRAGAISQGLVNFTEKIFIMLSDINVGEKMNFVQWGDPLMDVLLLKFLNHDPEKPRCRNKVRSPRISLENDGEGGENMKRGKKEDAHYHFTTFARNDDEFYEAFEKMGCKVDRVTGDIEYSDEALEFLWKKAEARQKGKNGRTVITPIFGTENPLERAI